MTAAASATATAPLAVSAGASASTSTRRSASRSVPVPVPLPAPVPIPVRRIRCYIIVTSHYRDGRIREKKRCNATPVYRVFTPDTPDTLDMCNEHFNEYFESHEISVDMVMRLSDNEDDFVSGNYSKSKRYGNGQRKRSQPLPAIESNSEPEPICQVPKPRKWR